MPQTVFLFLVFASAFGSASASAQTTGQLAAPIEQPATTFPTVDESKPDETAAGTSPTVDQIKADINSTRLRRSVKEYFALINYSPFDLILPSKYGLTLGKVRDADHTWELEYLHGSFGVPSIIDNIGQIRDDRYSFIVRNYNANNSFHWSYGLSYFAFAAHLGNKYISALNPNSSYDLVTAEAIGANLALGNRWTIYKNITFGVDWISWAQPIFLTKKQNAFMDSNASQQNKDDIDKAMNLVSYFPRFAAIKVQLGILF